jgi:putative ABC transport system permease protein
LTAFMTESLLLAALGGVVGLAAASVMQTVNVSTTNFQTFAELAFRFVLTPQIAVQSMVFALAMGVVGGFIPAWRAARLQIVDCLRAA